MILRVKKTLISKQYYYLFFTVLQSTLQIKVENINSWLAAKCETLTRILVTSYSVLEVLL